jgi:hypothetical protein
LIGAGAVYRSLSSLRRSSWRPGELAAGKKVIVQMLDRLPALGSNIRDEAPSAIAVSGGNGNLLRNVMHARQDARVRWRIA